MAEGIIAKTFIKKKKLGSGAFGDIYLGVNVKTNTEVAIKVERIDSQVPQLLYEGEIYKKLLADSNYKDCGIPHVYHVSTEESYNYMVMEIMGKSLEDLF